MYTEPDMGAPPRAWIIRSAIACAVTAIVSTILQQPWPMWGRAALLVSAGGAAAFVAFRVMPAFDPLGRVKWRLPQVSEKRCAVTFDDGPSEATPAVLDILAAEGISATFFVLGANAEQYPDSVRRAQAEGHAVGIHGMTHVKLTGADAAAVEHQVVSTIQTLARLGVHAAPIYRTPHGLKSPGVFAVARRYGLTLWAWSRGVWDTDRPGSEVLVRRATRLARSGMVLLLHDGRGDERRPDVAPMLAALPAIIRELKRRGFSFVQLAELQSSV
jgi:peptidoglycan/xylan/chitin deacetylase (PgdA/CDA1 family)